jgi:general secretion pathway protein M
MRRRFTALGQRVTAWWEAFSSRERALIGVMTVAAAVVLLFYGVVRPLASIRAHARADITTFEALNARLSTLDPKMEDAPPEQRTGAATAIAAEVAAEVGVTLDRNVAEGEGARIAIGEAPFDRIVAWVAAIERSSPLRISGLRLTRRPTPGFVVAEIAIAP